MKNKLIRKMIVSGAVAILTSTYCAYGEENAKNSDSSDESSKIYACIPMPEYQRLVSDDSHDGKFYLCNDDGKLTMCKTDIGGIMREKIINEETEGVQCNDPDGRPGMECFQRGIPGRPDMIRPPFPNMPSENFDRGIPPQMVPPGMNPPGMSFGRRIPMMQMPEDNKFVLIRMDEFNKLKQARLDRIISRITEEVKADAVRNNQLDQYKIQVNGKEVSVVFPKFNNMPGRR